MRLIAGSPSRLAVWMGQGLPPGPASDIEGTPLHQTGCAPWPACACRRSFGGVTETPARGAAMTGLMQRRPCHLFERVGVLFAAFAVAALLLPGSGQALVSQVSCGATITTDTQLDSD